MRLRNLRLFKDAILSDCYCTTLRGCFITNIKIRTYAESENIKLLEKMIMEVAKLLGRDVMQALCAYFLVTLRLEGVQPS